MWYIYGCWLATVGAGIIGLFGPIVGAVAGVVAAYVCLPGPMEG